MKLTPLDIHHKEFRHSLRGYSEEEVDAFLDEVADEFERLFKENIDLSEKLEAANERVRLYQEQEQTIRNTMIAAQRSADDINAKAQEESNAVLRDAEMKAKEIIHGALQQKQKVAAELVRIKQAEEDFRARFRGLLEQHTRSLAEINVPEDINVLMGETGEGVVGAVEVAPSASFGGMGAFGDQPMAAPEMPEMPEMPELPDEPPAAVQPVEPAVTDLGSEFGTDVGMESEPPASGFVESVQLGEMETPDLGEEAEFAEPKEFQVRSFDQLGERDEDTDIEEID